MNIEQLKFTKLTPSNTNIIDTNTIAFVEDPDHDNGLIVCTRSKLGNIMSTSAPISPNRICLFGDREIELLAITQYKITNFDSFTKYAARSDDGKIKIVQNYVYFSPNRVGICNFYINNVKYSVNVFENFPSPDICSIHHRLADHVIDVSANPLPKDIFDCLKYDSTISVTWRFMDTVSNKKIGSFTVKYDPDSDIEICPFLNMREYRWLTKHRQLSVTNSYESLWGLSVISDWNDYEIQCSYAIYESGDKSRYIRKKSMWCSMKDTRYVNWIIIGLIIVVGIQLFWYLNYLSTYDIILINNIYQYTNMARFIDTTNLSVNEVLYSTIAQSNPHVEQYVRDQWRNFSTMFADTSSEFKTTFQNTIESFDASQERIKQIVRTVDNVFVADRIIEFVDDSSVVTTNGFNQLFIMANPVVNQYYQSNLCQGFEDNEDMNWSDSVYKDIIEFNPYFLKVRESTLRITSGDSPEYDHWLHEYITTGDPIEELSEDEKEIVNKNWDYIEGMIARGLDPTDIDGGTIGKL